MTQKVRDYSLEMPPRMVSSCCNCGFLTDQNYVMPLFWMFMLFICTVTLLCLSALTSDDLLRKVKSQEMEKDPYFRVSGNQSMCPPAQKHMENLL